MSTDFIGGKEYYGNVYFVNGVKFAVVHLQNLARDIRVFETREASISASISSCRESYKKG